MLDKVNVLSGEFDLTEYLNTKRSNGEIGQDIVVRFINEFFNRIMSSQEEYSPEIVYLALWCKKQIKSIDSYFCDLTQKDFFFPKGLVFHIPPKNVDIIFMYPFMLSLLLGNKNIVRIPSLYSAQTKKLIELLNSITLNSEFKEISNRYLFVEYGHDDEITKYYTLFSDLRLIWGSDDTVAYIQKNIPAISPLSHCKDVVFSDKISYCLIDANEYLKNPLVPHDIIEKLFIRDSYDFSQKGCSSPKVVIWLGENSNKATEKFWGNIDKILIDNPKKIDTKTILDGLVRQYTILAQTDDYELIQGSTPFSSRIRIKNLDKLGRFIKTYQEVEHPGGGWFFEIVLPDLKYLDDFFYIKSQTLTYYGINKYELSNIKTIHFLSRIVPIGSALKFSPIWDGYNLYDEFTKRIVVD